MVSTPMVDTSGRHSRPGSRAAGRLSDLVKREAAAPRGVSAPGEVEAALRARAGRGLDLRAGTGRLEVGAAGDRLLGVDGAEAVLQRAAGDHIAISAATSGQAGGFIGASRHRNTGPIATNARWCGPLPLRFLGSDDSGAIDASSAPKGAAAGWLARKAGAGRCGRYGEQERVNEHVLAEVIGPILRVIMGVVQG